MLNYSKDYKRCIPISYHILDFVQQKKTKLIMEQPFMLHNLYNCQYRACWYPGKLRSQGISRHGIDPQNRNILPPASFLYLNTIFKIAIYSLKSTSTSLRRQWVNVVKFWYVNDMCACMNPIWYQPANVFLIWSVDVLYPARSLPNMIFSSCCKIRWVFTSKTS